MTCYLRGHSNAMSGKKRIMVDADDYSAAKAAAARLSQVNSDIPVMFDSLRRQNDARLDRLAEENRARQAAMEQSLAGLSEQTRKLERQMTRRLQARTEALVTQMREANRELRAETRQLVERSEARVQADLEEERRQREQQVVALNEALRDLRSDRDRALEGARTMLADAMVLRDAINAGLPHERFAPGRLGGFGQRFALAAGNLDSGLGEAALAQAQEIFVQLSELHAEVELRYQEWLAAQAIATSAVTALVERIRICSSIEVTGTDGVLVDGVTLDVDFWSDGELAELRTRAGELAGRVADATDPPDLSELRVIVQREAPQLEEQLTAIVGRAGVRQRASQVRVNLAEQVVTTLEQTTGYAWEPGQAVYAGEDPRRAFYSKLVAPDTSEIVVEVAPDDDGESCVLRIMSFDAGEPNEEARVERVHAIAASLRDQGLKISDPAAEPDLPDPALKDFDNLRKHAQAVAARPPGAQRRAG